MGVRTAGQLRPVNSTICITPYCFLCNRITCLRRSCSSARLCLRASSSLIAKVMNCVATPIKISLGRVYISERQLLDEAVDLRQPGGFLHLVVGCGHAAIADVVLDGVVEEHRILRHDADGGAKRFLRDVADVPPVDHDAASLHVIEAIKQPR